MQSHHIYKTSTAKQNHFEFIYHLFLPIVVKKNATHNESSNVQRHANRTQNTLTTSNFFHHQDRTIAILLHQGRRIPSTYTQPDIHTRWFRSCQLRTPYVATVTSLFRVVRYLRPPTVRIMEYIADIVLYNQTPLCVDTCTYTQWRWLALSRMREADDGVIRRSESSLFVGLWENWDLRTGGVIDGGISVLDV